MAFAYRRERTTRSEGAPKGRPARLERAHFLGTWNCFDPRPRAPTALFIAGAAVTDAGALERAVWAGGHGGNGVRRRGGRLGVGRDPKRDRRCGPAGARRRRHGAARRDRPLAGRSPVANRAWSARSSAGARVLYEPPHRRADRRRLPSRARRGARVDWRDYRVTIE